jgi:hypothetical protein
MTMNYDAMFQELKQQILDDGAADAQTKAMVLIGINLLEQTLRDVRRSADALERMADQEAKILALLEQRAK